MYLDSKATSAISVEPSVAHFAMGRMVQASKLKCHRSHNGITSFLGLTHMQAYAPVTMANAILSLSKSLFISKWRMVPLNSHKGAGPVKRKNYICLNEYQSLNSLILGYT